MVRKKAKRKSCLYIANIELQNVQWELIMKEPTASLEVILINMKIVVFFLNEILYKSIIRRVYNRYKAWLNKLPIDNFPYRRIKIQNFVENINTTGKETIL